MNKRTTINAIYSGNKTDIGYTRGKNYTVTVYQNTVGMIIVMPIQTNIDAKLTSYDTLNDFLISWTEITIIL